MILLVLVSLVWAVSFGLIKTRLAGVPPDVVNAARLGLALAVFLPFLRWRGVGARRAAGLAAVGAVQFGLMYALYTRAFASLGAHQVALGTALTPIEVTLLSDLLDARFRPRFLACAALAAAGTWVSLGARLGAAPAHGLALLQAANLCFAAGQVAYRRIQARAALPDRRAFAWCAAGAAATALALAAPALAAHGLPPLAPGQVATLAYLGVVASGLCFFLWNAGARRVNSGVLAVMNDLKIPLGVLVSLVAFGERAAWPGLLAGSALVAVAWALAAYGKSSLNTSGNRAAQ